mmetsp:Transcript_27846/g.86701  ORF Transcript_27846/g.86701 Transcript_27846/m.86701 type:complete len:714 (-) Transcript_27846:52-2193(-)
MFWAARALHFFNPSARSPSSPACSITMSSTQDVVGLSVSPGADLVAEGDHGGGVPVMVRLAPPPGTGRTPSDICCIVDVSGSMGDEAMLKTESGDTSGHGLSVLDVVKHSLKTIIMNLADSDRLALVAFSNNAETVFDLTAMDGGGRDSTQRQLEQLQPSGMTNLWAGLKSGIELLKAGSALGRLQHIMLFTDGLPNNNPPRGILPMLKKLQDKEPGGRLPCTINTFGFGYELDSELLSQLAIEGSGAYNFIPDAGFVGTVFVNSMSNLLVTMAKDVTLTLRPQNGASLLGSGVLGGHRTKKDGDAFVVGLGTLQYGQTKDVVVQMTVPSGAASGDFLQATLEYGTVGGAAAPVSCMGSGKGDPTTFPAVEQQRLRLRLVDAVRQTMQTCTLTTVQKAQRMALPLDAAREVVVALAAEIQASPVAGEEAVAGLLEDAFGQVSEALSREDWYTKWGVHYLPSLMFAHLTQQCNNFKDAGVQTYGGELFQTTRDAADDIFLTLPAPRPSARPAAPAARVMAAAPAYTPPPAVNMNAFYDRYSGCVDGACSVELAEGGLSRLSDLRRGDVLRAPGGGRVAVACVVRTRAPGGRFLLAELPGGLRLTPHHPVFADGAWRFPIDLAPACEVPCEEVVSLLLEAGAGAMLVEGVPVVSLGHGIEEGAARHEFFGCRAAVQKDLARFPGFQDGCVSLPAGAALRDPATGLVCAFRADASA